MKQPRNALPPYVIAISGTHYPLGSALVQILKTDIRETEGRPIQIIHIVRSTTFPGDISIYENDKIAVIAPEYTDVDEGQLECCEAIIHITGEALRTAHQEYVVDNLANKNGANNSNKSDLLTQDPNAAPTTLWSEDQKREVLRSRLQYTELLVNFVQNLRHPPKLFICTSEGAFYGTSNPTHEIDETSPPGTDVLAIAYANMEQSVKKLTACCKVVCARLGLLLSPGCGLVRRLTSILQTGRRGVLGDGTQWHSFITLLDAARALAFIIIKNELFNDSINICSPYPTTNIQLMRTLLSVCHSEDLCIKDDDGEIKTTQHFNQMESKVFIGELPEHVLFHGQKLIPKRLLEADFLFAHPDIHSALKWCLHTESTYLLQNKALSSSSRLPINDNLPPRQDKDFYSLAPNSRALLEQDLSQTTNSYKSFPNISTPAPSLVTPSLGNGSQSFYEANTIGATTNLAAVKALALTCAEKTKGNCISSPSHHSRLWRQRVHESNSSSNSEFPLTPAHSMTSIAASSFSATPLPSLSESNNLQDGLTSTENASR